MVSIRIKSYLVSIIFLTFLVATTHSQAQRNLLTRSIWNHQLDSILIPIQSWHPYPKIDEREKWTNIPATVRTQYIKKAEIIHNKSWESLSASRFLDFSVNGNRSEYEKIYFERRQKLTCLVLAEVFENRGKYTNDIIDGIWAICEESFWGVPAHVGAQKKGPGLPDVTEPIIDLFAAETGALLAWCNYLLGNRLDQVSPLIKERILFEEERRIITPYLGRNDFWWMGFGQNPSVNNWNPWINSNVLNIALYIEHDDARRTSVVYKSMKSVDVFMNGYPEDGGCDEGPGYWGRAGGSLFDYLDMLYMATDGKLNIYNEPLVKKIGQFIYKAWIHEDYYINFADASAINQPEAGLVYRFGKRINDPLMTGFGSFLALREMNGRKNEDPDDGSLLRVIPDLFAINDLSSVKPLQPYLPDFWLPGLQVMAARSHADSEKDIYFAAKGGHNAESHNHNDVGNFIVYVDGMPLIIDIGVETYTAKTFSSQRYDIWTMQSQYHNLPTINGVQQKDGRQYHAENPSFQSTSQKVDFTLDIAKAYPAEAMVNYWKREIILDRAKSLTLFEKYKLTEWREPLKINFMSDFNVNVSNPGSIILTHRQNSSLVYTMTYDKAKFTAVAEDIEITDARLKSVWGSSLSRIVLISTGKSLNDQYTITITRKLN